MANWSTKTRAARTSSSPGLGSTKNASSGHEPDSPAVDLWVRARDQWGPDPGQNLNIEYFLDARLKLEQGDLAACGQIDDGYPALESVATIGDGPSVDAGVLLSEFRETDEGRGPNKASPRV